MTYNRRNRMALEAMILIWASILFAIAIAYVVKLRGVPLAPEVFEDWWDRNRPRSVSESKSTIAMYAIPPAFTCILTTVDLVLYRTRILPLIYTVSMTSAMAAGWVVVLGLWGGCHGHSREYMPSYCYEYYLEDKDGHPVGVSSAWNGVVLTLVCFILITYLVYIGFAARDFHRAKKLTAGKGVRINQSEEVALS